MTLTGFSTTAAEQTFPIKANVINKTSNDADIESCWNGLRSKVGGCARGAFLLKNRRSSSEKTRDRSRAQLWNEMEFVRECETKEPKRSPEISACWRISINEIIESNLMFCPQRESRGGEFSFLRLNSLSIIWITWNEASHYAWAGERPAGDEYWCAFITLN